MSKTAQVTIDAEVGATYIQLSDNAVVQTRAISVMVDIDAAGDPVGIELLNFQPGVTND